MSNYSENDSGDYVLVHKSKAKISRARKMVIGVMAIGAVAALSGAGTFASFSASTNNDATFSTARLALTNNVGATTCLTPTASPNGAGATASALVTNNEASGCQALFSSSLVPGVTATKDIVITNAGDTSADLLLSTDSATCAVTFADSNFNSGDGTDLCDRIVLSVENTTDAACVFPTTGGGGCTALADNTAVTSSFSQFVTDNQVSSPVVAAASLATGAPAAKTFRVSVRLKKTTGNTACPGDVVVDGFIDANGRGCDNKYQNLKATMNLRWLIQA